MAASLGRTNAQEPPQPSRRRNAGPRPKLGQDQTPQLVAIGQTPGTIVGIRDDQLRGSGKRRAAAGWEFQATAQVQFRVMSRTCREGQVRRECPRTVRETYRDNCVIRAGVCCRHATGGIPVCACHRGVVPDLLCQDEFKAEAEAARTTIDELKARLSATCSSNCRNWIAVIAPLRHRRKGESTGGYATGANISLMGGRALGTHVGADGLCEGRHRAGSNVLQSDLRDVVPPALPRWPESVWPSRDSMNRENHTCSVNLF